MCGKSNTQTYTTAMYVTSFHSPARTCALNTAALGCSIAQPDSSTNRLSVELKRERETLGEGGEDTRTERETLGEGGRTYEQREKHWVRGEDTRTDTQLTVAPFPSDAGQSNV